MSTPSNFDSKASMISKNTEDNNTQGVMSDLSCVEC